MSSLGCSTQLDIGKLQSEDNIDVYTSSRLVYTLYSTSPFTPPVEPIELIPLIPIILALLLYRILAITDGKPQDFGHPL